MNSDGQSFELKSDQGVSILRKPNQKDYWNSNSQNIFDLQWVYPSNSFFDYCLKNCMTCSNGTICTICKPGTFLSDDQKSCIYSNTRETAKARPKFLG